MTRVAKAAEDIDPTPAFGLAYLAAELAEAPTMLPEDRTLLVAEEQKVRRVWLSLGDDHAPIPVDQFPFIVGRSADCHLVLTDRSVSRRHARIERVSGAYFLQDLGSSNGTRVNDEAVDRVLLVAGDEVQLGEINLVFRLDESCSVGVDLPRKRIRWFRSGYLGIGVALMLGAAYLGVEYLRSEGRSVAGIDSRNGPAAKKSLAGESEKISITSELAEPDRAAKKGAADDSTKAGTAAPSPIGASAGKAADAPAEGELRRSASRIGKQEKRVAGAVTARTEEESERSSPKTVVSVESAYSDGFQKEQLVGRQRDAEVGALLARSKGEYASMRSDEALKLLDSGSQAGRTGADQTRIDRLRSAIEGLVEKFNNAEAQFQSGNREAAFRAWMEFLDAERRTFPDLESGYFAAVRDRVVGEYHRMGVQAASEQRFQDAYRMWQNASRLSPSSEAARALEELKNRARDLFREGYRMESADLSLAKQRWKEVLELVPPDAEYHVKARAKLAWYARYSR